MYTAVQAPHACSTAARRPTRKGKSCAFREEGGREPPVTRGGCPEAPVKSGGGPKPLGRRKGIGEEERKRRRCSASEASTASVSEQKGVLIAAEGKNI